MGEMIRNRFVCIKDHIDGSPTESDFEMKSELISLSVKGTEVIVKNLYVSVDPYQINRMKSFSSSHAAISFASPITPGQAIDAFGVGRVVVSGRAHMAVNELVVGLLTWGEYTVVADEAALLNKLDPMGLPLSYHVGPLGFSGLTAYGGFFEVCKPKKGESVFVSAASGSVGSLVGQYAKLFGCRVVGCAGTQAKVDLLKEKLGFDDAFNYKDETDLKSTLKRYFPEGMDIYFDNVGGEMLEAAVSNMKVFGRVAVCGAISEYTGKGKKASPDLVTVVYKRITIQGFLAADLVSTCYSDFISATTRHLSSGDLHVLCDISEGVENVPSAFAGLFSGHNVGKKIVRIAHE